MMLVTLCVQAWYVGYGAKDILEQSCKNLERKIQVSFEACSDAAVLVMFVFRCFWMAWSSSLRSWRVWCC